MSDSTSSGGDARSTIIKVVLGFFGVIAAAKLLPRTMVFMARRYVFNLITELVIVVIAALLTEKIARKLTGDTDDEDIYEPTR